MADHAVVDAGPVSRAIAMLAAVTQDATSGAARVSIEGHKRSSDKAVAPRMNAAEYAQLVQSVHAHRARIEVDRVYAKKVYTSVPMDTMEQTIGEVPYFEKGIVCCALFASPVLLVGGIALGAFGLRWWTLIAAPIAVMLWFSNRVRSKGESAGMVIPTIVLVVAVAIGLFGLIQSAWIVGGLVSFLLALWCDRLIYVASTRFLRVQVLRNQRALEAYAEGIVIRNGP
jgi:hypothetical protein